MLQGYNDERSVVQGGVVSSYQLQRDVGSISCIAVICEGHTGSSCQALVWRASPFTREEGSGVVPIRELFQHLCNTYGYATKI